MWEISSRLLDLISLLNQERIWSAAELGSELGVTARTVRRDISRLRGGGYSVLSTYGAGGGYRLEPGVILSPLVLESDEAVALLLVLRSAQYHRSGEDGLLDRVFGKLAAVLPARMDHTMQALYRHVDFLDLSRVVGVGPPQPEPSSVIRLARACRERRRVHLVYRDTVDRGREWRLEPLRLAFARGRWYLIAFGLESGMWLVLEVNRCRDIRLLEASSAPRRPPAEDLDEFVRFRVGADAEIPVQVRLGLSVEHARRWVLPAWGRVEREGTASSLATLFSTNMDAVARWLTLLDAEVEVLSPPELREAFGRLAQRIERTAQPSRTAGDIRESDAGMIHGTTRT